MRTAGIFAIVVTTCIFSWPVSSSEAMAQTRLQGSGATFPAPLYKQWVTVYQSIRPTVLIDYQSIGSGGGIRDITNKTVHFAGSDAPLTKSELTAIGGAEKILEIPSCAGGVVPTYNLAGIRSPLNFTGEVLANIYLRRIVSWNDPAIAKLNPNVQLPNQPITPVFRTDGSGTTFIFTNYLATQSEAFKTTVGMAKQVSWPGGQGGKGNEGVTAVVAQTVGGIGYVEQNYADSNQLTYGLVQNKEGKFLKASPDSVSMAGAGAAGSMKGEILAADIWNQPGAGAYPIASFTYLIVYKDLNNVPNKDSAQDLADFLWWATHEGQKHAAQLDYAPLAKDVQAKVEAALKSLTYKGQALRIGSPAGKQ